MKVTRVDEGVYLTEDDGRLETVFVAGTDAHTWAFSRGQVYEAVAPSGAQRHASRPSDAHTLTAPMPGTILKVLVQPGAVVKKGETIVILEAMKMELPIRALDEGVVTKIHHGEGALVQADEPLVELGS